MPADGGSSFQQIGVAIAAVVILILLCAWFARRGPKKLPYFSRQTLLTPGEAAFYRVFSNSLPAGVVLCFKVRLCDLIDCDTAARREGYWSKIAQKHIDFVVADSESTAILLAVELDDRSHEQKERQQRDIFVDEALTVAGIPILRVPAAQTYDPRLLRRDVAALLRQTMCA